MATDATAKVGEVPVRSVTADDPGPAAADREGGGRVGAHRGHHRAIARLFRDGQVPRAFDPTELAQLVRDDKNFCWVDLTAYAESDLRALADALGLDPVAVGTALSRWRRPQLDVFGDHFFVSAAIPRVDERSSRVQAAELDLFVGRNYLLSVHHHPLPFADRIVSRADQNPDLVRLDSGLMLYLLLDQLLEYYDELTEDLDEAIERTEERALREPDDAFLDDLLRLKRFVFSLGRLADRHRPVFTAFLRPDFRFVAGRDLEPYYRDLDARLDRLVDRMESARDAVNGAFDLYVSRVSDRTNQIMKTLTIVSTVVLPATVVIGIFGTSFQGLPIYEPIGFVVMLSAAALISLGIFLTLRWRRWI